MFPKLKRRLIHNFLYTFILLFGCIGLLLIVIALMFMISPRISKNGWDLLAFLGSIIGGTITWWGVRLTITEQRREAFMKSYSEEMKALYFTLQEISFVCDTIPHQLRKDEDFRTALGAMCLEADSIIRFVDVIQKRLPELISSVEWSVVYTVDVKIQKLAEIKNFERKLRNTPQYIGLEGVRKHLDEQYIEPAKSIYDILHDRKELIMKKYEEHTSRQ